MASMIAERRCYNKVWMRCKYLKAKAGNVLVTAAFNFVFADTKANFFR